MKIVCAWCQRDGQGGILGEREPLDDPVETHGICPRHAAKVIEELPSSSFPGTRLLFVVRPTEMALYEHLTQAFEGLPDVAVIIDRRQGERRTGPSAVMIDRRRMDRRVRRAAFSSLGYLTVRFGPKHPSRRAGKILAASDRSS